MEYPLSHDPSGDVVRRHKGYRLVRVVIPPDTMNGLQLSQLLLNPSNSERNILGELLNTPALENVYGLRGLDDDKSEFTSSANQKVLLQPNDIFVFFHRQGVYRLGTLRDFESIQQKCARTNREVILHLVRRDDHTSAVPRTESPAASTSSTGSAQQSSQQKELGDRRRSESLVQMTSAEASIVTPDRGTVKPKANDIVEDESREASSQPIAVQPSKRVTRQMSHQAHFESTSHYVQNEGGPMQRFPLGDNIQKSTNRKRSRSQGPTTRQDPKRAISPKADTAYNKPCYHENCGNDLDEKASTVPQEDNARSLSQQSSRGSAFSPHEQEKHEAAPQPPKSLSIRDDKSDEMIDQKISAVPCVPSDKDTIPNATKSTDYNGSTGGQSQQEHGKWAEASLIDIVEYVLAHECYSLPDLDALGTRLAILLNETRQVQKTLLFFGVGRLYSLLDIPSELIQTWAWDILKATYHRLRKQSCFEAHVQAGLHRRLAHSLQSLEQNRNETLLKVVLDVLVSPLMDSNDSMQALVDTPHAVPALLATLAWSPADSCLTCLNFLARLAIGARTEIVQANGDTLIQKAKSRFGKDSNVRAACERAFLRLTLDIKHPDYPRA